MNSGKVITNFSDFTNESEDSNIEMDVSILDSLVELVGSEECVEECAKEAFEDLKESFEKNEVEITGEDPAENLAIASLVVKLVENGKLGPEDADKFIEENI